MTEAGVIDTSERIAGNSRPVDAWLAVPGNWIASAFVVLALQTVLVITHRAWLDEWQALQISLQSPTLSALFENLRYEGHPPPWYLILRAAGKVLPTGWVLPVVQLPIAVAIQALILFRLPVSRLERLLWACNPYVLIDYGAISRSLGLGALLFMAAILFRERRWAWIALALLPTIDFLFGILSVLLVLIFAREKRLWAPGLALWLVCGVASAWFVRPAPDIVPAFWLQGFLHDGLIELSRFGALLVPLAIADGHIVWNQTPPIGVALIGGLAFLAMGVWLLRRNRLSQAIFGIFTALILAFSVFIYPLAIRHVSLAALLLVMLISLEDQRRRDKQRFAMAWLGFGACCGIAMIVTSLLRPFDTAPRVAQFIIDHQLQAKHWASFPDSRAQGVSALTGVEFERLERNCTQSFIRWNYRSRINRPSDLEQELDRIATRSGSFYLLTDFDLLGVARNRAHYRQLLFVPEGVDGQQFFLYKIRPDLPETTIRLPQCPPKRLPLE